MASRVSQIRHLPRTHALHRPRLGISVLMVVVLSSAPPSMKKITRALCKTLPQCPQKHDTGMAGCGSNISQHGQQSKNDETRITTRMKKLFQH